ARVTLFTRDAETRTTFEAIRADWRFARVDLQVIEGDVEDAITLYQSELSPQLVIVQTDNIDNGFSEKLEALSASCAEGTAAMVIGPVNDVNLYRKLIGMGVSDYLVRPVQKDALSNDIAASLIDRMGASSSRLIVTLGAKGGVGTTVLTEGLAWGISENLAQKTFLLDAAGGWSTLAVGMDFEPATTLADALRAAIDQKEDSLGRMMFKASERLTVLSSGGDVMLEDHVQPEHFEYFLDYIMATYPVVIVDLSGASAGLKNTVLRRAHEILLVTVPTLPSVRASRTLIQEIRDLRGGGDAGLDLIINMQGLAPKHEVSKAQIEEGLERKASAVIVYDPALFLSTESGAKRLTADKAGATIVDALLPLARKVLSGVLHDSGANDDDGKKGGLGGLIGKLKGKG
ncbi:MAG: type II secretion protein ATPase, partial [Alphaproteobacteria bacterium]|nr:type II secretion protein ATPase [Alphaproteobacteria bacterium]